MFCFDFALYKWTNKKIFGNEKKIYYLCFSFRTQVVCFYSGNTIFSYWSYFYWCQFEWQFILQFCVCLCFSSFSSSYYFFTTILFLVNLSRLLTPFLYSFYNHHEPWTKCFSVCSFTQAIVSVWWFFRMSYGVEFSPDGQYTGFRI